jgi:hypothetical protein
MRYRKYSGVDAVPMLCQSQFGTVMGKPLQLSVEIGEGF